MVRFFLTLIFVVPFSAGIARAQSGICAPAPLWLRAHVENTMEYFDVWLQGAVVSLNYKFGFEGWVMTADIGGPDYEGNGDQAYWFSTSLDPSDAVVFKINEGHSDYLSGLTDSKDAGYDFKILDGDFSDPLDCIEDSAEKTGALGVERATWEERWGRTRDTDEGFRTRSSDMLFIVTENRISAMTWIPDEPAYADEGRAASRDWIPDDAEMSGASAEGPRTNVLQPDIYQSDWLANRFTDASVWEGAAPGTLTVSYEIDASTGYVLSVTTQLGDHA